VKHWTDRLIALQFLMVVLPVTLVLVGQSIADARSSAALADASRLQNLGHEIRASYKTFTSGVADAVDTGQLGGQAFEALGGASAGLEQIQSLTAANRFGDAAQAVAHLATVIPRGAPLASLLPLREQIRLADKLTQQLDEQLTTDIQAVIHNAIRMANLEKLLVPLAIVLSIAVTCTFVIGTQRRLRSRQEADERVASENLRIKNALDNCSSGIMVTDAQRRVVYANQSVMQGLKRAEVGMQASTAPFVASELIGTPLQRILAAGPVSAAARASRRRRIELGGRIFIVTEDPVVDAAGRPVGCVLEWTDRTEQVALEQQTAHIVEAAGDGDFRQRISVATSPSDTSTEHDFVIQLVTSINRLMHTSETGLHDAARVLEALAQGNLTERITNSYRGTFDELKNNSNRTAARLQAMVGQIKTAAAAIDNAANELFDGSADLRTRAEMQAARLRQTSSAMQDLSRTVRENADGAREAAQFASGAADIAATGGEVMRQAVTTMSEISDSSRKISQIIAVVNDIAFQTNLLALNAAVEAARAGEQGRSFAVVASEVRSLAGRSAAAASEIKKQIGDSVTKVAHGMDLVQSAGKSVSEVVGAVQRVTSLIGGISAASQNQSVDINGLGLAIAQLDEATQRNTALVDASATAAESLREQAAALVGAVAVFKLEDAGATHLAFQAAARPRRTPAPSAA
jgi:methyl-accepting chemotaxis protein